MYLVAQRVVGPQGEGGISVFWYSHKGQLRALPASLEEMIDLTHSRPGTTMLSAPAISTTTHAPYVASLLDVVGLHDDVVKVQASLRELNVAATYAPLDEGDDVFWCYKSRLALRFHTMTSPLIDPPVELRRLRDHLQRIVGGNAATAMGVKAVPSSPSTLVITRSSSALGYEYRVEENTRHWLESNLNLQMPNSLKVSTEAEAQLRGTWGEDLQFTEFVQALTSLRLDALRTIGNVVIEEDGEEVWRA